MEKETYLVFDIETAILPWDTFSESQQEYIVRNAVSEEDVIKKKNEMGLSPLTAQVACIGFQFTVQDENGNFELKKRAAYSVDNKIEGSELTEVMLTTGDSCYLGNERTVLDAFWKIFRYYPHTCLISFNGRNFDVPFLMLRSALLKMKPTRNLMDGTKFSYSNHIDLIDKLTFFNPSSYGATKRFNFDFYTRAFGIESPKAGGVDGSMVTDMYYEGKILEISEYCLRDIVATWELFLIWKEYLKF